MACYECGRQLNQGQRVLEPVPPLYILLLFNSSNCLLSCACVIVIISSIVVPRRVDVHHHRRSVHLDHSSASRPELAATQTDPWAQRMFGVLALLGEQLNVAACAGAVGGRVGVGRDGVGGKQNKYK